MFSRNLGSSAPRTRAMARPTLNQTRTPATLRADLGSAQPGPPWRFTAGGVENGGNCGSLQLSPFSTPQGPYVRSRRLSPGRLCEFPQPLEANSFVFFVSPFLTHSAEPPEPDGISVFFPFSAVNTTGPSLAGGVEVLQNYHTDDVTAFLVVGVGGAGIGAQKINLTTPALIKPILFNDVYNIGDNNLNYSGAFVAVEGTATYVLGATTAFAYTPQQEGRRWNLISYWARDIDASYSNGFGPAGGIGGGASISVVEYIPLVTYREGRLIPEAGAYLLDANQQGLISQMVTLGVNTISQLTDASDPK